MRGSGRAHVALRPVHGLREEAHSQGVVAVQRVHIRGRQPRRHDGAASPRRRPPDVRPRGDGEAGEGFGDSPGGEPGRRNRRPLGGAAHGGQEGLQRETTPRRKKTAKST